MKKKKVRDLGGGCLLVEEAGKKYVDTGEGKRVSWWTWFFGHKDCAEQNHTDRRTERRVTGR